MNKNAIIGATIGVLVAAFAIGAYSYKGQEAVQAEKAATPADPGAAAARTALLERKGAQRIGSESAKVVVVEFFDPACETCAEFAPRMKSLAQQSGGRVAVIERYAPLHPGSTEVAVLLEATAKQDKYFEALELLFEHQAEWASHQGPPNMDVVMALLEKGGIDIVRLNTDKNDPAVRAAVAEDDADRKGLGVTQTPEFFVNGRPLPSWGWRQLTELVAQEADRQYGG